MQQENGSVNTLLEEWISFLKTGQEEQGVDSDHIAELEITVNEDGTFKVNRVHTLDTIPVFCLDFKGTGSTENATENIALKVLVSHAIARYEKVNKQQVVGDVLVSIVFFAYWSDVTDLEIQVKKCQIKYL